MRCDIVRTQFTRVSMRAMIRRYRIIAGRSKETTIQLRGVTLRLYIGRRKRDDDRARSIRRVTHMEMLISLIKGHRAQAGPGMPFAFYMEIVIVHLSALYARAGIYGLAATRRCSESTMVCDDRQEPPLLAATLRSRGSRDDVAGDHNKYETIIAPLATRSVFFGRCFFSRCLYIRKKGQDRGGAGGEGKCQPRPNVLFAD